jgi:hypothetical protein
MAPTGAGAGGAGLVLAGAQLPPAGRENQRTLPGTRRDSGGTSASFRPRPGAEGGLALRM